MTEEERKKYPNEWLARTVIFVLIGFGISMYVLPLFQEKKPSLRSMFTPQQLQQIEQNMQSDQQYQQFRQENLPGIEQAAYGGDGLELDPMQVAVGLDTLFKRDDYLLEKIRVLEQIVQRQMHQPQMQQQQLPQAYDSMPR